MENINFEDFDNEGLDTRVMEVAQTNPNEACEIIIQDLEGSIEKLDNVQKGDNIRRLLDIFDDLEGYICNPNFDQINFVKDSFGVKFEHNINYINEYLEENIINFLKDQLSLLENEPSQEDLNSKEGLLEAISEVLKNSDISFKSELNLIQIEYLLHNKKECKNFLSVLKMIVRIKELPNIRNREFENKHILSSSNRDRISNDSNYSGRISKTRSQTNTKHINISECIETNLSGKDRFIFRMFDIDEAIPKYEDKIYIIVLGDPPYSH